MTLKRLRALIAMGATKACEAKQLNQVEYIDKGVGTWE